MTLDRSVRRFWEAVRTDRHHHVAFWLGSAVSYFPPSSCASVEEIKFTYVLETLRQSVASHGDARRLVDRMLTPDEQLAREVRSLPFEQFMHCLDIASQTSTLELISLACRYGPYQSTGVGPNAVHVGFVEAAAELLRSGICREVAIYTTNYDTFLEQALRAAHPGTEGDDLTWKLREGSIRLVKVHGCVSQPSSLVYSTQQWTHRLLDETFYESLKRPDALLFAGYSFSDPHLRPVFERWRRQGTYLFALFKPKPPDRDKSDREGVQTGADYLRDEFIQKNIADEFAYCDLNDPNSHPAHGLGTQWPVGASVPVAVASAGVPAQSAQRIIGALNMHQVVELLSGITESCALGDADALLARHLNVPSHAVDSPQWVARYLLQLGHKDQYDDAIRACQDLRARFSASADVVLITNGYESYARTVKGRDLSGVGTALDRLEEGEKWIQLHGNPSGSWSFAESFFAHRKLHFSIKALSFQLWPPDRKLLEAALKHPRLQRVYTDYPLRRAWELLNELNQASQEQRTIRDLYGFAQLEDLRAELLVAAASCPCNTHSRQDAEAARAAALRVRDIYFSVGQLNSVVLADRTLGWTLLALREPEQALKAFTWALLRSLRCTDLSLRWKVGANLVRLLPEVLGATTRSSPSENQAVEQACHELIERGLGADRQSKEQAWAYVRSLYPSEGSRVRLAYNLGLYADTTAHPIFFPPDP